MKVIWKLLPLIVLVGLAVVIVSYGPTLIGHAAYAVAAGESRAARDQLAKLSRHDHLSVLFREVAKAVKPSVVIVHVKQKITYQPMPDMRDFMDDEFFRRFFGERSPFGRQPRPQAPAPKREFFRSGIGSGVIVDADNGYVLTNWHVVRNADQVEVVLPDKRTLAAEWVRTDALTDLAIIKVKPDRLIAAPLGDSDKMEVGDWVLAIGAPEGLPQTVTAGIISAKGRHTGSGAYQNFLQTDAAINHGNSGGPLVNMRGEVVGISSAIVSRTGVNEGIGLAVPSNMARHVMRQLIDKGKVTRGYLGVRWQNITEPLAKSYKLPNMEGALVAQVIEDSPADKAGMKEGDFIVKVNGRRVRNGNDLRNAVAALRPGRTCEIEVYREGVKKTLKAKITPQPADMFARMPGAEPETTAAGELGLKVAKVTDELAKEYGYKKTPEGVIIVEVEPNSDAAKQGLKEGTVIQRVQGRKVTTPAEFRKAVTAKDAKAGVRMHVMDPTGAKQFVFVSPMKKK